MIRNIKFHKLEIGVSRNNLLIRFIGVMFCTICRDNEENVDKICAIFCVTSKHRKDTSKTHWKCVIFKNCTENKYCLTGHFFCLINDRKAYRYFLSSCFFFSRACSEFIRKVLLVKNLCDPRVRLLQLWDHNSR